MDISFFKKFFKGFFLFEKRIRRDCFLQTIAEVGVEDASEVL